MAVSPSRMGLGLGIAVCGKSIWLSGALCEIVEDIGHHDIVFLAADHRRHSVEILVVETVAATLNRIQDSRRILFHSLLGILYVHEKVVGPV